MNFKTFATAALLVGVSGGALAQSRRSTNAQPPPQSATIATQPAPAAADMQAVLDAHAALMPKPIETLTPVKARLQPSAADATKISLSPPRSKRATTSCRCRCTSWRSIRSPTAT